MFEAVVFDLDGTLVDSYAAIAECYNHARTSLGESALAAREVRRLVGHGLESLMAEAVGEARMPAAVRLFRERYAAICEEGTQLLPGVHGTIHALHRRRVPMGVATNKPERFALQILKALDLMPPLQAVRGPGPLPAKPDPAMVAEVLGQLGVSASATLFIGDMPVDVETARRAGMQVWVVATGSSTAAELRRAGADGLLDRFEDLLELVVAGGRC